MRNSVTHSLIAHHFVANWSFVARSSLFWFKNSLFRCEVVKNAFSWKIQDWLISMQAIYQRFLLDEFFVHIHIISELIKSKCQNEKTKKLSQTKRVFYPKKHPLNDISIYWLVFVHIRRSLCTQGDFVRFLAPRTPCTPPRDPAHQTRRVTTTRMVRSRDQPARKPLATCG